MPETFPFRPNWSNAPEVTLSYKTDTFTSRSGYEQRRALRSTPRRRVDFTSLAHRDDMLRFSRLMATKQNADFLFPDWMRAAPTHGIASGSEYLSLRDIAPEWVSIGAKAFLVDGDTVTQVTIASVSAYTVELLTPVAQEHSAATVLRPAYAGLLATINSTVNTSNTVSVQVSYDVTPGSVPNSDNLFFPYVVDGKEVFSFPWNWGESVAAEYSWQIENVDFDRGVITTHRPVDFGKVGQTATVLRHDPYQIDYMQRFIERQKGQCGQFWMPTGTEDLTVVADVTSGATTLTVAGTAAANDYGTSEIYRGVALYLRDGRRVYRKFNSIIASGGNSALTLSAAVTTVIPASLIAKVSWMSMARFASDEVTLEYLSDSVAQWQTRTVTVTYGSDEQDYASLDGAANWVMDNWGEESQRVLEALDFATNVALPFGDVEALGLSAVDNLINNSLWDALTFGNDAEDPVIDVPGGGLPPLPAGYSFLLYGGDYLVDGDGDYFIVES